MQRKNILVLVDENNFSEEFKQWISNLFEDENLSIRLVNQNNLALIDKDLVVSDKVFNFLSGKIFELIQKKIESLKIDYFGNNLATLKLLSEKANFKKIIQLSEFKTPVFEKIGNRTALELFNNFPQPSRIFSKTNHYFSDKISSLEELEGEILNLENKEEFYIEEFIDGVDIKVLFLRVDKNNLILPYFKDNNEYFSIAGDLKEKIQKDIENFVEKAELKDFAIFDLKFSEKRGLYFLNVFLKNIDFFKNGQDIKTFLDLQKIKNLKEILNKNLF